MAHADRYVVIGNPIGHSKSPEIHARFAAQTGQAMTYERLLAPLDGFEAAVRQFIQEGGRGANITVPFKLEAWRMATQLTQRARLAGAVNTFQFTGETILGDNTDGVGMVRDIVRNAGVTLRGKRILVAGAGGAVRGVLLPLLQEYPSALVIANRTAAKAQELVQIFSAVLPEGLSAGMLRASDYASLDGFFDVVINGTSASLTAELAPIPASAFSPATFAYDMMYGPGDTPFMQFARAHGARVRDGLGMLVEQAAESFLLWRGVRPDTAPVYDVLRQQLAAAAK